MINYNILIIDGKNVYPYFNLNETEFLEKLWRWTYIDELFDTIKERDFSKEDLEDYLIENFIPEDVFHNYEDDDLTCFAFTASDEKLEVKEFDNYEMLLPFIMDKIIIE